MESVQDKMMSTKKRKLHSINDTENESSNSEGPIAADRPAKKTKRYAEFPEGLPNPMPGDNAIVDDPRLLAALSLSWDKAAKEDFQSSIPRCEVTSLKGDSFIPSKDVWAAESDSAMERLEARLAGKKADNRLKPKVVRRLDQSEWRMVVDQDTSCFIVDADTKQIVGAVIRNFIGEYQTFSWLDSVAEKQLSWARDVRRDDMGKMTQYGYSTGPRSGKVFTWIRNVLKVSHSTRTLSLHTDAICSAHTLIWNIIKKKVPSEIVDNVETAIRDLPGLDWNMKGKPIDPIVSLNLAGQYHRIGGLDLGPPSGICSTRYSRYCHRETTSDTAPWVLSLTTRRDDDSGIEGGNFYLAEYGVLIKNASNSFIAHKNNQFHGTTPLDIDWTLGATTFEARGFSLLLPRSLREVWKKFEAEREIAESEIDCSAVPRPG